MLWNSNVLAVPVGGAVFQPVPDAEGSIPVPRAPRCLHPRAQTCPARTCGVVGEGLAPVPLTPRPVFDRNSVFHSSR